METKTYVINLIAEPSAGKSTLASELFAKMKWLGYEVELVSEYAKELVWEQRNETMKNEVYLFGKQHHRLFRLKEKVKFIITDRPLILSILYNNIYGDKSQEFTNLVKHEVNKFNNINFLLKRTKPYNPNGRNQSENEAREFGKIINDLLVEHEVKHTPILAVQGVSEKLLEIVNDAVYIDENNQDWGSNFGIGHQEDQMKKYGLN